VSEDCTKKSELAVKKLLYSRYLRKDTTIIAKVNIFDEKE
jgi:hypothetical protein